MNVAEVIDGAIEAIETHGWCQQSLLNADGQLCLRGALYVGAGAVLMGHHIEFEEGAFDEDAFEEADSLVVKEINKNYVDECSTIPRWNDHSGTSAEDVILVLKRARETADG